MFSLILENAKKIQVYLKEILILAWYYKDTASWIDLYLSKFSTCLPAGEPIWSHGAVPKKQCTVTYVRRPWYKCTVTPASSTCVQPVWGNIWHLMNCLTIGWSNFASWIPTLFILVVHLMTKSYVPCTVIIANLLSVSLALQRTSTWVINCPKFHKF